MDPNYDSVVLARLLDRFLKAKEADLEAEDAAQKARLIAEEFGMERGNRFQDVVDYIYRLNGVTNFPERTK
jgi:hypothetical protein